MNDKPAEGSIGGLLFKLSRVISSQRFPLKNFSISFASRLEPWTMFLSPGYGTSAKADLTCSLIFNAFAGSLFSSLFMVQLKLVKASTLICEPRRTSPNRILYVLYLLLVARFAVTVTLGKRPPNCQTSRGA